MCEPLDPMIKSQPVKTRASACKTRLLRVQTALNIENVVNIRIRGESHAFTRGRIEQPPQNA